MSGNGSVWGGWDGEIEYSGEKDYGGAVFKEARWRDWVSWVKRLGRGSVWGGSDGEIEYYGEKDYGEVDKGIVLKNVRNSVIV